MYFYSFSQVFMSTGNKQIQLYENSLLRNASRRPKMVDQFIDKLQLELKLVKQNKKKTVKFFAVAKHRLDI